MLNFITRPIKHLTDAVLMPFKALFVVGLTGLINAATYHGQWWFKWVALGMGIAVLVAFARAAKTVLLLALVSWAGFAIYKRYGTDARQRFDDWMTRAQPEAAQVISMLRPGRAGQRRHDDVHRTA